MRRTVLVMLLFLLALPVFGKVYLVSIGIANYPGREDDLRVSAEDAITISNIFRATKTASVRILTNREATKTALLSTMNNLFAGAGPDDTIILYFSGHGMEGALVCYDGPLSYKYITNQLKEYKARKRIVIVDACFAGKMRNHGHETRNYNSPDVMFFLSSRTNELSLESPFRNSLFTIYLERGLRGGADTNFDRRITARELYDFVHIGVINASHGNQHPVMWGNFDNNMTVIKW